MTSEADSNISASAFMQSESDSIDAAEEAAEGLDLRSALVLVEAQPTDGGWRWHGMAFVAGETIEDTIGADRTVILDDLLCSVAAAGVEVEPGETEPTVPKSTLTAERHRSEEIERERDDFKQGAQAEAAAGDDARQELERLRALWRELQAAAQAAIDDPHSEPKLYASAVAFRARAALGERET